MASSPLTLLTTIAWRNLWRHQRRTLVILFALMLGIWSMVFMAALIRGSMEQHINKEILNLTGHVQIHATGYRDEPAVEHRFVPTPSLSQALQRPPIIAVGARVRVPAVISSERESAGVMLVGLGLGRMGRLIQFIPHPVTTGFTAGIGVVIATIQVALAIQIEKASGRERV